MLDIIFKTNINKINSKFDLKLLYAGILYDKDGRAINKILFYEKNGFVKEVWNDECYSLDKNSDYYIDDIVYVGDLFMGHFGVHNLNLAQLYTGYKIFLNDTNYLYNHLNDFGMEKKEIGYKGKVEIKPYEFYNNTVRQEKFMKLVKIINYMDLNKYEENKEFTK